MALLQDADPTLGGTLRAQGDTLRAQVEALRETELFGFLPWSVAADLIRIAVIVLLALVAIRILRGATGRLQRDIDEPDLVRKRLREQRAKTLASLLNNVGMIVILGITALTPSPSAPSRS